MNPKTLERFIQGVRIVAHDQYVPEERLELQEKPELIAEGIIPFLDRGSCIFFFLSGTPPKGYAIYTPEPRSLSLYDDHGKRFRIIGDVKLKEAE